MQWLTAFIILTLIFYHNFITPKEKNIRAQTFPEGYNWYHAKQKKAKEKGCKKVKIWNKELLLLQYKLIY